MIKYINNFTEYQLEQFDQCFKKVIKNRLMSFYSYLTYHNTNDQKIKMSIDELTNRWNNKHKKKGKNEKCVCRATIYNWIKKLESARLIKIYENISDTFVYTLIPTEFFLDKELDKELDNIKLVETIDMTTEVYNESCDNTESFNIVKDIDSNSCSPVTTDIVVNGTQCTDNFDYENYVQDQEKITSWEYISPIMEKMFITMKVKSSWIKGQVIDKLFNSYSNITKKHCVSYICTTISNARKQSESNYNKYVIDNNTNGSKTTYSRFNDFPQRDYSREDLKAIEYALLGW